MVLDELVLAAELQPRHGVTTRKRLRKLGMSEKVIDGLIRRGRLRTVGRGVLVGTCAAETFEQRVVVACALTGGVATYPTAGLIWEFRKTPRSPTIHVTIPWERRSSDAPGVVVHRCRDFEPYDVVRRRDGIMVFSPPKTAFDAARFLCPEDLESLIEQGLDRRFFIMTTLWSLGRRLCETARPGSSAFMSVLASRPTWQKAVASDHELRLERALRQRGFPEFVRGAPVAIAPGTVVHPDLGIPEYGFYVEIDHLTWHGGRWESAYDRRRDLKVRVAGCQVERVTNIAIDRHLEDTVADLWTLWERHRGKFAP